MAEKFRHIHNAGWIFSGKVSALAQTPYLHLTVMGETGQKIIRAIFSGERDGELWAKHRNNHIKSSEQDIAKALQGFGGKNTCFS